MGLMRLLRRSMQQRPWRSNLDVGGPRSPGYPGRPPAGTRPSRRAARVPLTWRKPPSSGALGSRVDLGLSRAHDSGDPNERKPRASRVDRHRSGRTAELGPPDARYRAGFVSEVESSSSDGDVRRRRTIHRRAPLHLWDNTLVGHRVGLALPPRETARKEGWRPGHRSAVE